MFSSFSYGGRSSLDYVMPFLYCGNTTPRDWYLTSTNIRRHVYPTSMRAEFFCLSHPFQQPPSKCALHVFAECVLLPFSADPLRSTYDFNKSDNTTDEEDSFIVRPTCSIINDLEQLTRLAIWSSPRLARPYSVDFTMPELSHMLVIFTSEETFPEKGGTSLIEKIHQLDTWNQAMPTFLLHAHLEFLFHNQEPYNLFRLAKKIFIRPDSITGCFESTTYMNTFFPLPDRSKKPELSPPTQNISICSHPELHLIPVSPAMNGTAIANECYTVFSQFTCRENNLLVPRSASLLLAIHPTLRSLSSIEEYRCQVSEGRTRYDCLKEIEITIMQVVTRDYNQMSDIISANGINESVNGNVGEIRTHYESHMSTVKSHKCVEDKLVTNY